ncbi:MAG TPA: hypothetical protein VGS04_02460 [Nitrososphaerales archaeon]|nr:hypothetical protein [Nitrososphaerales archaeon]
MPNCPNGHAQRLGLKCQTCGAAISYRDSIEDLRELPRMEPNFGKIEVITVGYPGLSLKADYVGEIFVGQADAKSSTSFEVASIRGGSWLDFSKKYLGELRRWMTLVSIGASTDRFLIVDTTDPLSVLLLSAFPKLEHTAVIAVVADQNSTPVEQNTSYVALSLALSKGFPIVALSETFEGRMLYLTEDRGFAAEAAALSRLLESVLGAADDLMDLLERDLKLGIKMHCLSAIVAGSKAVYGMATNAFLAQSYDLSMAAKDDDCQTVHSLAFSRGESEGEFEKSFGAFRNKRFKGALNAEFRFHETASPLYDIVTIYGMRSDASLQGLSQGYQAIVGSVPELSVEGAS